MTLINEIRNILSEKAREIKTINGKIGAIDKDIQSKKYSEEQVNRWLYDKRLLKNEIERIAESAKTDAGKAIADYQEQLRAADCLKPEELTDDAKLLGSGLKLLPRDVEAIIARNAGNRTMIQLAVRYAKDHDLEISTKWYGNEQAIRNAEEYNYVVSLYTDHWIATDKAFDMLDKFLPEQEEE